MVRIQTMVYSVFPLVFVPTLNSNKQISKTGVN